MSQQQGNDNQGITPEHLRNLGNQVPGNDMAAPEPLATTEPDESAQATIEDKLNNILFELAQLVGENSSIYKNLQRNIQAIITTETTNARINTLQELQPCDDHYDSKAVHLEDITAHIAALQEEQL